MAQESLCEPSVFERIYKEHSKPLYRFLYYKYGDEVKSEDLVNGSHCLDRDRVLDLLQFLLASRKNLWC